MKQSIGPFSPHNTPFLIFAFCLCIYAFLFGIQNLSSAFSLLTGPFATSLFTEIKHPLVGFFVGILATALMQSSSATNSIAVTMIAANIITLSDIIPIFMGANIGTTITNSLVSLGTIKDSHSFQRAFAASTVHDFFNILTAVILLPLEIKFHIIETLALKLYVFFVSNGITLTTNFDNPIRHSLEFAVTEFKEELVEYPILYLIVSFMFVIGALTILIKLLKHKFLQVMQESLHAKLFENPLKSWLTGSFFTFIVQSSSVTTSLIIPFASNGTLSLKEIYPYTVGANFGTGITTFLAALSLNHIAFVAAIAALLFDIFGSMILYPMPILGDIPLWCSEKLSKASNNNKMIPFAYILLIFIILPLIVILF